MNTNASGLLWNELSAYEWVLGGRRGKMAALYRVVELTRILLGGGRAP